MLSAPHDTEMPTRVGAKPKVAGAHQGAADPAGAPKWAKPKDTQYFCSQDRPGMSKRKTTDTIQPPAPGRPAAMSVP